MPFNKLIMSTLLCLLIVLASAAQAQPVKEEQTKLDSYQRQLDELSTAQQQLEQNLQAVESKLDALNKLDSPEKDAVDQARAEVSEMEAHYQNDPSSDNKGRLAQAQFKLVLAERKFAKANSEFAELQEEQSAIQQKMTDQQDAIETLRKKISQQEQALASARANKLNQERALREQQQRQLELQRKQAEEAQAEVARLKALLAAKAAEEEKAAALKVSKAPAKPAAAAPATANIGGNRPAPATPAPATPMPATSSPVAAPTAAVSGIKLLSTASEIAAEEKRLADTLQGLPNRARVNRVLHIKPDAGGKTRTIELNNLGKEQYRGEETLSAGSYTFIVGFNRWPQTIPASADGKHFQFIFDMSGEKPRLVYFQK